MLQMPGPQHIVQLRMKNTIYKLRFSAVEDRQIRRLLTATSLLFVCGALLFPWDNVWAQQSINVAVISDGPGDRLEARKTVYLRELMTLAGDEFDIVLQEFSGSWSKSSVESMLAAAYADPKIDMLLVTGFSANQIAAARAHFPKPTFLPVLLDSRVLASLSVDNRSAIPNLNYLTIYADFADDIVALRELVNFDNLVLMLGVELSDSIPQLKRSAAATSEVMGVDLTVVTYDGVDHDLMTRVPAGTEAIFVAGLSRMPTRAFDDLVESINVAKIASYSFVGVADVDRGLLMTSSETRDVSRQARLNALNMQAVMLGERAEDQPVTARASQHYSINMETARILGVSPSFDVRNVATLINERAVVTGQQFGLIEIAHESLAQNQDLLAQSFGTRAGNFDVDISRSNLLPQVGLSASHDLRKVSPSVSSGVVPERTTDGALSLQQIVYSDSVSAGLTIEKQLQIARAASLQELRLNVIQAATSAYYNVLNAQAQLQVQNDNLVVTRRNLDLARDRVELGSSSIADVYRWEAEEARSQIQVLNARALVKQTWNSLNRLLHRPQDDRIVLRQATFDEPFVIEQEEFDTLVESPADYEIFSKFFIRRGLQQAPELAQVDAQLAAKKRELVNQQRSYWLPDFSLGGRYSSNLNQSGVGAGPGAGQDFEDWTFGLQATLPLFSGGAKRASVSRADFELRQLQALRISTEEKIEEEIRRQLHLAQAGYGQIALTGIADEASRKNFDLVADAYARGTKSIIDLLDAQDASLSAKASSIDSLYSFLITVMALQRAVGGFDYLLAEDERTALADAMRQSLQRLNR